MAAGDPNQRPVERTRVFPRDASPAANPPPANAASSKKLTRASLAPGIQLNGIYEVDVLLATGGMGEVYRGHAVQTGDLVAIKVILPELTENADAVALFRNEASALHQLYHEAIVRYYVFSKDPSLDRFYLAMEFVEGLSLAEILKTGALEPDQVLRLGMRVALGLHAAHERRIIHRDISPDNIIIQNLEVDKAKIIDFGIARSTQPNARTIIGSGFAGKYSYVSPEQLGLFGANVAAQSDLYSLGLVLAEASGKPINMKGSQAEILDKRRHVPDLSAFEPRLKFLLERMLQPDPQERPESMLAVAEYIRGELGASLQPTVSTKLIPSPPQEKRAEPVKKTPTPVSKKSAKKKSSPLPYILAGGALLVLAAGGGYVWWATKDASEQEPRKVDIHLNDTSKSQETAAGQETTEPKKTEQPLATDEKQKPVIEPPPVQELPPAERMRQFVRDYRAGSCTALTSVNATDKGASVMGFGASVDPFNRLDEAFRKAFNLEADIVVRIVASSQCPLLTFYTEVKPDSALAPKIDLGNAHSQSELIATVTSQPSRQLQVLLMNQDGSVQKLSSLSHNGALTSFKFEKAKTTSSAPRLIVGITSDGDIPSLKALTAVPRSDQLFMSIAKEARETNDPLGVTIFYINPDNAAPGRN